MKNRRAGIITQARLNSTRLPDKVLLPLGEETILAAHVRRLRWSGLPVVVATTKLAADGAIVDEAASLGAPCHRGSETNVLSRYHECALRFGFDVIVRVTSDCPLIDGNLIRDALRIYRREGNESTYMSNTHERSFPRGFDFEIFSFRMLEEANGNARDESELEHVTPYFRFRPDRFPALNYRRDPDASMFRVTVDTEEDLLLVRTLVEEHGCADLGVDEIVRILFENPRLGSINAAVEQKKSPGTT